MDKILGRVDLRQPEGNSEKFARILAQGKKILHSTSDPNELNKIEVKIGSELHLHYRLSSNWEYNRKAVGEEIRAVQEMPDLAHVFMFHGDGRVREEAIRKLAGPLPTPANVYALFWRLNDWVPAVRNLSYEALRRVMPFTSAMVVVPAT